MLSPAAAAIAPAPDVLRDVLAVSLTGIIFYTPVYDPAGSGAIVDFTFEYLNPAAQRMMAMPEVPTVTHNQQWPHSIEHGTFAFHVEAFESGEPREYNVNYQADGYDNYYRLAARRSGAGLLVSFTDTADQPRSPVEVALRESQAAEKAARADAEEQRAALGRAFEQAPISIAILRGPEFVVELANPSLGVLWGRPVGPALGRPLFEALPDMAGQGLEELLAQALRTGEPLYFQERPTLLARDPAGPPTLGYYNFTYQPLHDAQGQVTGLITVGLDVTEQVLARQQVQQLNQELEARVEARTAQLRHHQRLLPQIMRQVPAAIATLSGPEHRYTFFNDAYHTLSGGRARVKLPVAEVLPEIMAQGFGGLLDQVYATGQPFIGTEMPVQVLDAATARPAPHFVDVIYQPLTDGQGRTEGVLAFVVDVTEKVRARQQVEALQQQVLAAAQRQAAERESLYRVFAQTPAVVALLRDPGHRFEYVNPAYQALFPGRPLVGHNVAAAVPELAAQGFVALLDNVYRSGETYFGQELPFTPQPAPDQAPRTAYYNFTYQAYREDGEVVGISIFAYDVTEQVLARRERDAERQQLHELFMQAPAPIVILDGPELVFQLINPAYQRIFPGRDLLNKTLLEALPELIGTPIPNLFGGVYQTGEPVTLHELPLRMTRHEGAAPEDIYWTFTYQARRDAHGRIDGVRVFAHDVTDQVQARRVVEADGAQASALAEQLRTANEQLVRTNVDLDNFIYTASHDLKAPISNIEGLLDTLRDELPPQAAGGEVPYILELMQDSVNRFTRTIEHLTDVSRLQKEHTQPHESVLLADIIEDVRLDLAPLLQQTGGQLDIDVRAVPTVQFSVKNLRSVVYNLISNALKYHHPDRPPLVQVRGREEGAYHVLEVQDNGLGLDLTREPELFGMFRRYHTHVDGSGIGLYMVKRMVENTGGRIEVHSTLGEGSTFTVYFPRP